MLEFELPEPKDFDEVGEQLTGRLTLEPELPPPAAELSSLAERTYYDTFDGRLHRASKQLLAVASKGRVEVRLHAQAPSGARPIRERVSVLPRFAWDLPPGPLRAELEPIVEMRALLPQARLRSEERRLAQRDANGKTVVRLALERHELVTADGRRPLCARARVEPLKGYAKASRRALRVLEQELRLERAEDLLTVALTAQGRGPSGYSSRITVALEPALRADAAVKQILAEQCRTMLANVEGMCGEVDTEFLHDFRVAVRRSRSALSRIRGVFPSRTVERYRRELRWLGQLTGPARDYDVYLLEFDELASDLPRGLGRHLSPLKALLTERRHQSYDALREALQSRRGRRLLTDFEKYVTSGVPKSSGLPNACRPIGEVADEATWRSYRRVLRHGRTIGIACPAAELHELRKRCKALRYMLEFFRSLFPAEEIGRLVGELKSLQKILGAFQDQEVQSIAAARWGLELAPRPEVGPKTTLALGALAQQLASRQEQSRRRFRGAYERFTCKDNRKLARSLLRSAKARNLP
ncbi:MAG: CHAD domain-containing protein [Deltaproteobacteria bacterium]|jgi:CHAD domain-containing protein|nr:CHAD domain-containing protein [Deltaproteobacteria bacterium]MBW2530128.1 CHAD domain-containing protein [Deltaproteobacteria bacterium]